MVMPPPQSSSSSSLSSSASLIFTLSSLSIDDNNILAAATAHLNPYFINLLKKQSRLPAAQVYLKLEELAHVIAAGLTDKEITAALNPKRRIFY